MKESSCGRKKEAISHRYLVSIPSQRISLVLCLELSNIGWIFSSVDINEKSCAQSVRKSGFSPVFQTVSN